MVLASAVSRLTWATKSVCTIAAACPGSFSARDWSPKMPNASTAVRMGPCSATIDSTSGAWDARSSASNSPPCTTVAPAARTAAASSSSLSARRAASNTVAPGASRVASSTPISLRPPKITISPPSVSFTVALISCASVGSDGEGNYQADQRRAGVSHRTASGHVDDAAHRQHPPCGGGRFHLRPEDAHRQGDHHGRLAEGCERRRTRCRGAQPGRRRTVAVAGGQGRRQHRNRGGARRRAALRPALSHAAGQPAPRGHRGPRRARSWLLGPARPRRGLARRAGACGHYYPLVRPVVDRQCAVGGDDYDVLDARPPLARKVDARLDGERHAFLKREGVARDDVGLLVHRQPDAVARAVHERLRQAVGREHVTRGGVHLFRGYPRAHRIDGGLLGALYHRVAPC